MKNTFFSKSANRMKDAIKKAEKKEIVFSKDKPIQVGISVKNSFVAWIGRGFPKWDSYTFKHVDVSQSDLSILVNVKLLVVIHTIYTQKINAVVNFAFEYGIPILWINNVLPPKDKAWFFSKISKKIYWELICQTAK